MPSLSRIWNKVSQVTAKASSVSGLERQPISTGAHSQCRRVRPPRNNHDPVFIPINLFPPSLAKILTQQQNLSGKVYNPSLRYQNLCVSASPIKTNHASETVRNRYWPIWNISTWVEEWELCVRSEEKVTEDQLASF